MAQQFVRFPDGFVWEPRPLPTRSRGRRRRRPWPQRLGHLQPHAGQGAERRHRRRRGRPLQPVPGGRSTDGRRGAQSLPLLRRLAARSADRHRPGERQGPGLLRPPHRRAAPARDRALAVPLSLGSPQALQDRGGWGNRDIASWFADYALIVAGRIGDRAKHWVMLNEPSVVAIFGHGLGGHAPDLRGRDNYCAAIHHQNLAQGRALAALRAAGGRTGSSAPCSASSRSSRPPDPTPTVTRRRNGTRSGTAPAWTRCSRASIPTA